MIVLYGLALYLGIGIVTAVTFVTCGVMQVAHAPMTVGARLLVLPGATVLWPLIVVRWRQVRTPA